MIIIKNSILPLPGFGLMNILGLVFSRKPASEVSARAKRHEQTHTMQQYEILMVSAIFSLVLCNIFASWWYLLCIVALPFALYLLGFALEMAVPPYHNAKLIFEEADCACGKVARVARWARKVWHDAYRDNCFEREAYMNDDNPEYLATRHLFAWVRHIIPNKDRKNA